MQYPPACSGQRGVFERSGRILIRAPCRARRHGTAGSNAGAARPVSLAGRYHYPCRRRRCQRGKQRDAGLLRSLPRLHRQPDTSVNHTPIYSIVQGKALIHLVFNFPSIEPSAPPYKQLEYYRRIRGLSKEELGASIDVPATEITNYEKQFQEIYFEQAQKLAKALNISPDLLLDDYSRFVSPGYGKRIKEIRWACGVSQQGFSERLGVARSIVAIWEAEIHRPSRKNYERIISCQGDAERNMKYDTQ